MSHSIHGQRNDYKRSMYHSKFKFHSNCGIFFLLVLEYSFHTRRFFNGFCGTGGALNSVQNGIFWRCSWRTECRKSSPSNESLLFVFQNDRTQKNYTISKNILLTIHNVLVIWFGVLLASIAFFRIILIIMIYFNFVDVSKLVTLAVLKVTAFWKKSL